MLDVSQGSEYAFVQSVFGSVFLLKKFQLLEKRPYSEFFWSLFSHIWAEYGKIPTRKTPNTGTFHVVGG